MLAVYLALVVILLFIISEIHAKWDIIRFSRTVQGPKFIPIIGGSYIFFRTKNVLQDLITFKFPLSLWIGHTYNYWTSDPKEIKDILSNKDTLNKSDDFYFFKFVIGDTLLMAEDQVWRVKRKIASKCFVQNVLNSYVSIFYNHSCDLADELLNDRTPKLLRVLYKTTMNIFFGTYSIPGVWMEPSAQILTGTLEQTPPLHRNTTDTRYSCVEYSVSSICRVSVNWRSLFQCSKAADLQTTATYDIIDKLFHITDLMIKRVYNPFYHYDFIYFKTPEGILLTRGIGASRKHLAAVIEERRKTMKDKPSDDDNRKSILEFLLEEYPTDKEALDEIILLAGAASTTTKSSIAFTCVLLAMHPEIQDKVHEEIASVVGNNPIDYKNLPNLKLTERVIQECLRLFPVTIILSRKAKETVKIGEKTIPKGTNIKIFILDVHRNEKYWADPLKFDPDRFLPKEVEKREPYAYLPFSAGIRNCIGYKYGMMMMKTVVAVLVQRFRLTTEYKSINDITLKEGMILDTVEELKCTFTPRKR